MNKLLPVLLLGLMVATTACEKKEERILPKVGSADQAQASEQTASERVVFIRQAQEEIDELGIKLADIRKKAVSATGKAKEKLDRQLVALEQEMKNVEEKLARLKSEVGEKWKDLKAGVTAAIGQLKKSLQDAI
jgi:predicted  nucleic acid-binding Zn-ribbon protein